MSTTDRTPTNSLAIPSTQDSETPGAREAAIRATFHIDYDSDSDLSDPPNDLHSPTGSDASMHPNSPSSSSSESSSTSSGSSSSNSLPPAHHLNYAHNISAALSLTVCEAWALRTSMQAAMQSAGLLGRMSFLVSARKATARVLKPVFARVKGELGFLAEKEGMVGKRRLQEVLIARARILNRNEKHNVWMVKNGRVGRRRVRGDEDGAGRDEGVQSEGVHLDIVDGGEQSSGAMGLDIQDTETTAQEDELDDVQDQDRAQIPVQEEMQNDAETGTRTSIPITLLLSSTGSEHGDDSAHPSTSHPTQADTPINAQPNTSHPLQPTLPANAQPTPAHNQPTRPPSHPTAFLIRHTATTSAAAILSTPNLTLTRFTALVSAQLGFDATGRIRAVVPRSPQAAPVSIFVRLDSEETWRAMVEIWAVWGRRVGEAVVD